MGRTFHVGAREIGLVATFTQGGYAADFFIGLTTVIAQILIPLATELASSEEQGCTIGNDPQRRPARHSSRPDGKRRCRRAPRLAGYVLGCGVGTNTNNALDTGYAYANAAMGVFNSYSEISGKPYPKAIQGDVSWFVQDKCRIGRRFTLDNGMRFYMLPQSFGSPTDTGVRAIVTGNPVLPKNKRTFNRFFETSVFLMPAIGTWDAAIYKQFPIRENMRLQFRRSCTTSLTTRSSRTSTRRRGSTRRRMRKSIQLSGS